MENTVTKNYRLYERSSNSVNQEFDFGITDQKGRKIGFKFSITQCTIIDANPENKTSGFTFCPALENYSIGSEVYSLQHTTTRDGKAFGASNRGYFFNTLQEAFAKGNDLMNSCAKRYANKISK